MKIYTKPSMAKSSKPSVAKKAMTSAMKMANPKSSALKLVLGKYKTSRQVSPSKTKANLSVKFNK